MTRLVGLLVLAACGGAHATGDAALDSPPPPPPGAAQGYRMSLAMCWTDATCPRAMAIAHGGSWDLDKAPYDSTAALVAAYYADDDGVKIDVRAAADGVLVIAHSSPIEVYESTDCAGQKIEEMTAAQVTACHRFPSETETFQRLDDVLTYLRGKLLVQLCVKLASDYAATIAFVHAQSAADFAFIEINAPELGTVIPPLPGSDGVYYLVDVASDLTAVDGLLALHNPRAFMYEFDPSVDLGDVVSAKLHPAGVRGFVYDDAASPTVELLQAHYVAGADVVSSQSGPTGVAARVAVNTAHGVTPP